MHNIFNSTGVNASSGLPRAQQSQSNQFSMDPNMLMSLISILGSVGGVGPSYVKGNIGQPGSERGCVWDVRDGWVCLNERYTPIPNPRDNPDAFK